jgi:hypothetical protein
MSKSLEYYTQKRQDILQIKKDADLLLEQYLEKFKKNHISEELRESTSTLQEYKDRYDFTGQTINSFQLYYRNKTIYLVADFRIDQNKKNVVRVQVQNILERSDKNSTMFFENIKHIMRKKEIIFEIIKKFEDYILFSKKIYKQLNKYSKLIFVKRQEKMYLNFNKVFKKARKLDIDKRLNKYYKTEITNSGKNEKYKEINFIQEEYYQKHIYFITRNIKIFNYKKNNEFYVLDKKIISKERANNIISKSLIYKDKALKILKDIPFDNENEYYDNECSYIVLSKFLNLELMIKNIKEF